MGRRFVVIAFALIAISGAPAAAHAATAFQNEHAFTAETRVSGTSTPYAPAPGLFESVSRGSTWENLPTRPKLRQRKPLQRWYDATTGTWLSEDSVGVTPERLQRPMGINPWLYADGNPTRFSDREGTKLDGPLDYLRVLFKGEIRDSDISDYNNNPNAHRAGFASVGVTSLATVIAAAPAAVAGAGSAFVGWLGLSAATMKHDAKGGQAISDPATATLGAAISTVRDASKCASNGTNTADRYGACIRAGATVTTLGIGLTAKGVQIIDAMGNDLADAAATGLQQGAQEVVGGGQVTISPATPPALVPPTASAATTPAPTPRYAYRGVHANHPEIENAKQGNVVPGDLNGGVTPEEHAYGGSSDESPYTSWTTDPSVAKRFAQRRGPGGVVLRVPLEDPPPGATWNWEDSPNGYNESEILMLGPRQGATVLDPAGPWRL